jgi:hypothetical protein
MSGSLSATPWFGVDSNTAHVSYQFNAFLLTMLLFTPIQCAVATFHDVFTHALSLLLCPESQRFVHCLFSHGHVS